MWLGYRLQAACPVAASLQDARFSRRAATRLLLDPLDDPLQVRLMPMARRQEPVADQFLVGLRDFRVGQGVLVLPDPVILPFPERPEGRRRAEDPGGPGDRRRKGPPGPGRLRGGPAELPNPLAKHFHRIHVLPADALQLGRLGLPFKLGDDQVVCVNGRQLAPEQRVEHADVVSRRLGGRGRRLCGHGERPTRTGPCTEQMGKTRAGRRRSSPPCATGFPAGLEVEAQLPLRMGRSAENGHGRPSPLPERPGPATPAGDVFASGIPLAPFRRSRSRSPRTSTMPTSVMNVAAKQAMPRQSLVRRADDYVPEMRRNVGPTDRLISLGLGGCLTVAGLAGRKIEPISLLAGGYLLYRGLTGNC